MEYFETENPKYESVASIYINNPNKTSYLILLANEKAQYCKELGTELYHYIHLIISLVSDYAKGIYRDISIRTIIASISALIYFVYPKETFLDKVPGVKLLKEIGLLKVVIKSFKKDLIRYEIWKEGHEKIVEV